jgi:hypothetical protein
MTINLSNIGPYNGSVTQIGDTRGSDLAFRALNLNIPQCNRSVSYRMDSLDLLASLDLSSTIERQRLSIDISFDRGVAKKTLITGEDALRELRENLSLRRDDLREVIRGNDVFSHSIIRDPGRELRAARDTLKNIFR